MLKSVLDELDGNRDRLVAIAKSILEAQGGKFYSPDFLAWAAINRTQHLIPAFKHAVATQNFLVAAPLLRMHLDTCLRYSALWLVKKPHSFADEVLSGKPIRHMKDRNGKKLTDKFLVQTLTAKHEWVEKVYEKCSAFVHMSEMHIFTVLQPKPNGAHGEITLALGLGTNSLEEIRFVEAVAAFNACTDVLMELLEGWLVTKEHPELIGGMGHHPAML